MQDIFMSNEPQLPSPLSVSTAHQKQQQIIDGGKAPFTEKEQQQASGKTPTRFEFEILRYVVYFALLILLVGFVSIIIQYFQSSSTSFNNLTNQINQQNTSIQILSSKIDLLVNEINQQGKTSQPTK